MSEGRVSAKLRRQVTARANGCCEYCYSQEKFATQIFSIEHIVPRHEDGATALENLALACQGCNSHKHIKTEGLDVQQGQVAPLYHPRQQNWSDHFCWNQDYSLMIGLTPTGRATVKTLRLNRSGLVNLRRALYALGEHPPQFVGQSL